MMSNISYNPALYSSERLTELAKLVIDTDMIDKTSGDNKSMNVPLKIPTEELTPKQKNIMIKILF